jgi:parallel beta-helix repeat protein
MKENTICMNNRSGILTCGNTTAVIDSNTIEDNQAAGVIIKDPSFPEIKRNEIGKNFF